MHLTPMENMNLEARKFEASENTTGGAGSRTATLVAVSSPSLKKIERRSEGGLSPGVKGLYSDQKQISKSK